MTLFNLKKETNISEFQSEADGGSVHILIKAELQMKRLSLKMISQGKLFYFYYLLFWRTLREVSVHPSCPSRPTQLSKLKESYQSYVALVSGGNQLNCAEYFR